MKKMNKKGAEMTIGTIVIIVLALIVLVVLVIGFTGGWSNLWTRITSFFGGSNVDSIVQACQVACTTGSKYDYCSLERTVKFDYNSKLVTAKSVSCIDIENKEPVEYDEKNKELTTIIPATLTCDIDCSV